jgi:hypothetical protein
MISIAPGLLAALTLGLPPEAPAEDPDLKPPVVRVPLRAQDKSPPRALRYALLPDSNDLTAGNAAAYWIRASLAAQRAQPRFSEQQEAWLAVPLDKLPKDEVRRFLEAYRHALRMSDQAARCQRCDWERPPLTFATADQLPTEEIGSFRQLAQLLSLRLRLELSEGRRDDAIETIRTGMVLARHIAEGHTVIDNLVAAAIGAVMLNRVEEFLATPGAPNLYWSLTTLPRPFFDARPAAEYERGTLWRSFPVLRRLAQEKMTPEQARRLNEQVFGAILDDRPGVHSGPDFPQQLAIAVLAARTYPDAKRELLARGLPPNDVEAMPVAQVVLLAQVDEYDAFWDEALKWMAVPYAEARAPLEALRRDLAPGGRYDTNMLIRMLFPVLFKVHEANLRGNRQIEALRCVEAIRHYAATHGGKPPAALTDIRDVPLPIDPITGKGFDAFYKADGDRAVLDVPPLTGMPPQTGRRYEFAPEK